MMRGVLRTLRYARSWKAGADVVEAETAIERDGEQVPATLVLPASRTGRLPGWVAVGGMTRTGRRHPQLVRFTRALASTGAAVIVPEIPEWQDLKMSPGVAGPTIRGGLEFLKASDDVLPGQVALIGFSFGAPQVALAAACADLGTDLAGVVLFGSYCSLHQTVAYQFTGHHKWEGQEYELTPDPYGRWVLGYNHLTDIPGLEDATDVAKALGRLSYAASGKRIPAWDPRHDPMIEQLRETLPQSRRHLFDHFATPTNAVRPDREELFDLARRLADACRRMEPQLEVESDFAGVQRPTRLIHGRGDRLIPFTEGMRLMTRLPETVEKTLTVTGLFSHTADRSEGSAYEKAREGMVLFGAMRGLLTTV